MSLLNFLIEAYSSIWYGIFVAIIIVVLLFLIIAAGQDGKKCFSPLSYALGVALVGFLSFQCTFMIGAMMFKSDCTNITSFFNDLVPNRNLEENANDIRESLQELENEVPFIKNFIDVNEIDKSLPDGFVGDAILSKVHSYLNWYIARRILWSLLECFLAGFGIFYTMERNPHGRTLGTRRFSSSSRRIFNDDF